MQLNALGNYLQNQPLHTGETQASSSVDGDNKDDKPVEVGAYSPSQRAIFMSAVAAEFDVLELPAENLSRLQSRLQQYGLVQGTELGAFSIIHNAKSQLEESESLNALAVLDEAKQRFDIDQVGYSQRMQINRIHTLVQNLASARMN